MASGDEVAAEDPEPANLDQAGQFARRSYDQLPAARFEMHAIVADQHGRRDLPGASGQDQIERQSRFAGARGPADQHRPIAHQHG